MRLILLAPATLLLLWLHPAEAVDEDSPPVTFRFHCRRNGCCDHHEWCRFWASVGECKTNAEWMIDNCQLACNTCKVGVTTAIRRPPLNLATHAPHFPQSRPPHRQPARVTHAPVFPPRRPAAPVSRATVRPVPRPAPVTAAPHFARPVAATAAPRRPAPVVQQRPFFNNRTGLDMAIAKLNRLLHQKRPHFRRGGLSRRLETTVTAAPTTTTVFVEETTTVPITTTESTTTTTLPTTTTTESTTTTTVPTTTTTVTPSTTTITETTTTTTTTTVPTTTTTTVAPTSPDRRVDVQNRFRNRFQARQPAPVFTTAPFFRTNPPTTTVTTTTPRTTRATTTTTRTTTTTTQRPTTTAFFRQSPQTFATEEPILFTRVANPQRHGNVQRCREIINDPLVAAEEMIRERLVISTEDNSQRKAIDLDQVIRSNLANACVPRMDEHDCESNLCYNAYFRTMDGSCNNMANPLRGASYRPYTRLLPTVYDNDLSEPVGSLFRDARPSPREITRTLTSSHASVVSDEYNALVMQFGQFISHDMAKTTLVPSSKCNVCQNITSRCMSVPVTQDDTNDGFRKNTCIRVSRSSPICGSGRLKPRQQLNENTGYIDASPIYGSSVHDSQKFRMGSSGFLKLPNFNGMQFLPFDQNKCRNKNQCTVVFTAGDSRVNLFVGLSAWHTMFTREHNRIASTLQRFNPHWDGERLYQESRKIVGAQVQAIVYREWLPKVLGASFANVVGDYHGYDSSIDSTIANEFTSGAFRFGHGMIQEFYQRLDTNFFNITFGALEFQKGTLHSDVLVNQGGPDPLIRGMFSQNVKRPQRITTTVTENMFGSTDLSSINIQRGRDHGHPGYVKYRELCGLGSATNFDHLSREILNTGTRDKLQRVYGSVDRIDLWVGALLEDPVIRGLVGPTVSCIIGPQFKRSRDGDRFYYENPGVFTRRQLAEIRKSSLSRIICDNAQTITTVPREAFRMGHLTPCSQIPQMDLSHWRE